MLIPLLCMVLLAVMIRRTAKKHNVANNIPLAVSVGLFFVFYILSRGMIKVRSEDELMEALALGLLLYAAVGAVLYGLAYVWIVQASRRKQDTPVQGVSDTLSCPQCGARIAEGAQFCTACGTPSPSAD